MSADDFRLDRLDMNVLAELLKGDEGQRFFGATAQTIRDRAREGARSITSKVDAIIYEVGTDAESVYADIGYSKHHPGFFLWWWEVGTKNHAPRPHLRPALAQGL